MILRALSILTLLLFATVAAAQVSDRVPYVPSPPEVVEAMLDLAALRRGERLIDLGSGDGRIVVAAAGRGADALGIENDGMLVARARIRARLAGIPGLVRFRRGDLFTTPIRDADVVTLYLLPSANLRLRPKLLTELKPGARIVSHSFHMGDWTPDAQRMAAGKTLFLWIVPAVAGGGWRMTLADGRTLPLVIEQRYQRVSGTLDGVAVTGAVLSGDRLRFRWGGETFGGVVGERAITPDAATAGWRAERAE